MSAQVSIAHRGERYWRWEAVEGIGGELRRKGDTLIYRTLGGFIRRTNHLLPFHDHLDIAGHIYS